ncbi:hypothetical protein BV22DRAFT_1061876 [Leucogyrophana mollusca]|uniref:Uncharacterized protein n=1 Tax=Leucogyrophana mollusca TaxID=85980 RepID=A0ACB8BN15_9AGAM|nr:hypothetical protein BV22DRAFT_1061876 [Leucogyrophana mollusca]
MDSEKTKSDPSTSSNTSTTSPPQRNQRIRVYRGWPSIHVVRPPSGRYSPHADEHCFTYCSQSAYGRAKNQEPWCRSLCIRRVFTHEVKKVLAHDKAVKPYPLPPEGQEADYRHGPNDIRFWEEGWYLWTSKSRWAAQERLDLMMWDLGQQDHWQRHKDQVEREWDEYWAEHEKQRLGEEEPQEGGAPTPAQIGHRQNHIRLDGTPYPVGGHMLPKQPSHTHPWQHSLMVRLPPPFSPFFQPIQNLLTPTFKVMTLLRRSYESGAQGELARRMWEKACSRDPFVLASTVCRKMWDKWKEGPPDDTHSDI